MNILYIWYKPHRSPSSNGHYEYHVRSSQYVLHDPRSETLSFGCFQMTHTCNICDSTFTQRSNLSRHHRSQHGGEKFACSSSDKSFSRCDNLQRHQKSCSGQVYQCPRCHRKMSSMEKLTSHMGHVVYQHVVHVWSSLPFLSNFRNISALHTALQQREKP